MVNAEVSTAEEMAVAFGRVLRGAGLAVPLSSVISFAEALGAVGLDRRDDVYWAGQTTLVRRPEDFEVYARAFRAFFDGTVPDESGVVADEPLHVTLAIDTGDDDDAAGGPEEARDEPTVELRYSATEVLRHKDFADYDDAELADAQRLMSRLRVVGSPRPARRLEPAWRATARPDLRRTVRAAMRTEGEAIRRHFRTPATRHRRIVLLLDISGSMEPYARALLRFAHAAVAGRRRIEAFAIGTRLTRLTRELTSRDPDTALRQAAERVVDWSGGTRLGDGIAAFNSEWGVRGMARGADVVVLSDGWDRGDPDDLAAEMARLRRVANRVIWVNPLKVTDGYAPLARGMAAALPHVDRFVAGHSVAALDELTTILNE